MAVIHRDTFQVEGPNGREDYTQVVKYSLKSFKFTIDLPDFMKDVWVKGFVEADTYKEVSKAFKSAMNDYRNLCSTFRQVILYSVTSDPVDSRYGCTLKVIAAVYSERVTKYPSGSERLDYTPVESSLASSHLRTHRGQWPTWNDEPGNHGVLDWTEQRETFFKYVLDTLAELTRRVNEITKDEKTLLGIADAGLLLTEVGSTKEG